MTKFLDKLAKEKVAITSTQWGPAKLKPSYQFNRDLKASVPSDFLVSRQITLELNDFKAVTRIMDISISVGSFILESVTLGVKDKEDLAKKSFNKAFEDARAKADSAAKSAGAAIDTVSSIEELGSELQEPNLIQDTDFAALATAPLKESDGAMREPTDESGEGALALSDDKDKSNDLSSNNWVQHRTRLRVTFTLK